MNVYPPKWKETAPLMPERLRELRAAFWENYHLLHILENDPFWFFRRQRLRVLLLSIEGHLTKLEEMYDDDNAARAVGTGHTDSKSSC